MKVMQMVVELKGHIFETQNMQFEVPDDWDNMSEDEQFEFAKEEFFNMVSWWYYEDNEDY